MDDFHEAWESGSSDDAVDLSAILISVLHIAGGFLLGRWLLRRLCCQRWRRDAEEDTTESLGVEHLQPKKRLLTSYILWLVCGPLTNAHHYYLGRVVHGMTASLTLNLLGVGWILDACLMPFYVRCANASCNAKMAPRDDSRRVRYLVFVLGSLVGLLVCSVIYLPFVLNKLGVVDIDIVAAQTQVNPYELLGIGANADLAEAKAAYRKLSLKWHPDRNHGCGKRCEAMMSDITKAFDLIKRRAAPPPVDRSWQGWAESLAQDWKNLIEAFTSEEEQPRRGKRSEDL